MANVFKRDSVWYIRYKDPSGKDKRVATDAKTKRKAEGKLAEILQDIDTGVYESKLRQREVRFFEICDDFMAYSRAHKRSWSRDEVSVHKLRLFFGDVLAQGITRRDIENYIAARRVDSEELGRAARNSTINRELACLKTMFKRAEQDEKISTNPTKLVKLLEEDNVRDRVLNETEFKKLLMASPVHQRPALIMAWETGMRKGEILGLTWDRVKLREGFIHLRGQDTKTARSRKVPISPALREVLERMKKKEGYVFTYLGQPIERYICTSFKRSCHKAGIEDFRFHDLRHCFVTRMRRKGVPDRVIMQITGHTTLECFSRYDTISEEDLSLAVGTPSPQGGNSWHNLGTVRESEDDELEDDDLQVIEKIGAKERT